MALDTDLELDGGQTLDATATTTAIDVEGGFFATFRIWLGAITPNAASLVSLLQVSVNGGTNYFSVGSWPTIDGLDDNINLARCAFIPKPKGTNKVTKVRMSYTVSGSSPSIIIKKVFLEPIIGAVPPAVDVDLEEGLALLI